ncbi:methyl-accepting chemotaxis protein [Skermanella stibiiresistens SB22]|uniref:Methyl-accepting chemotaxis protein n=1 Tax=Skermanella stibiiresistens SB22 TaxID=1385369 RepID=W9H9E6_9PROT|nr:HAMP domain-containing methyl-accepting chemotaxis protein [Skermanella stibiiresistens]EWY41307.1 methyl-accepting chemotaxis protein [Skermanella stibiiresistens SB22]
MLLISLILVVNDQRSMSDSEANFGDFSLIATNSLLVADVESALLTVAVGARDYQLSPTPQNKEKFNTGVQAFQEALKGARDRVRNPERVRILAEMDATWQNYESLLVKTIGLVDTQTSILNEEMAPLGASARRELSAMSELAAKDGKMELSSDIGNIVESFLLARLNVYQFLQTNSPDNKKRIEDELTKTGALLKDAMTYAQDAALGQRLTSLTAEVSKYRGLAAKFTDATARRTETASEAVRVRSVLVGQIADVMKSQQADQSKLRQLVADDFGSARLFAWIGLAVALLIGALCAVGLTRTIAGAVQAMTKAMQTLAQGDTQVEIPARGRGDEIGAMAAAVQVFKENAIERIRLEGVQAAEAEAKEKRTRAVERLIGDFDGQMASILRTVSSAATELDSTAQSMAATAEETSRQATASAGAAEQTSANVQTVASAAEEMTGSLMEISRQVTRSTGIANDAVTQAERTDGTVRGLAEAAQKINDVVELISTIAGQTNLLALNATIEAARAGEHGKGFAVVASEVKNLANQTAKATQDITAQIAAIQAETNGAVTAIQGIGGTIRQMNEITTTIAAAVEEQNAATAEISRNVAQAAAGTQEVSLNVGQVMEASAQTGSAATQVLGAAGELSQQAEMLRAEVERFLAGIRAA